MSIIKHDDDDFLKNLDLEDLSEIKTVDLAVQFMKDYFVKALNSIIKTEFDEKIGFVKYSRKAEKQNYRNGNYTRKITTPFGEILLVVPRDRNGEIKCEFFTPYSRRTDEVNNLIFTMLREGLVYEEIIEILDRIYNKSLSKQTLSNMYKNLSTDVEYFNSRQLPKEYKVVYLDSTYLPLKRNSVQNEAVNIAVGIDYNGYKSVLGYEITANENKIAFNDLLTHLKEQGVEKVDLFVFDGMNGLDEVVNSIFPNAQMQRCLLHISRNIQNHVRKDEREEITNDFKLIYEQTTLEDAQKQKEIFIEKWSQRGYKKYITKTLSIPYLFTYYNFPSKTRKAIYTNNAIESLNGEIKVKFKEKRLWQNQESLEKALVSFFNKWNYKKSLTKAKGFGGE